MNYRVSGCYGSSQGGYKSGFSAATAFGYRIDADVYSVSDAYSSFAGSNAYSGSAYGNASYQQPEMHSAFIAETFLVPDRAWTPVISRMDEVREIVEETYEKLTGQEFPEDAIKIIILEEDNFYKLHTSISGSSHRGVMGFSFNKYGKGVSEIFIKQDHLDSLLLTIGHEIGHVLSYALPDAKDEEAKAHAFSIAWMETIRDNNIGGLQPNILLNPAKNGLHDVAYEFVKELMKNGASALEVFKTLSGGLASIIAEA